MLNTALGLELKSESGFQVYAAPLYIGEINILTSTFLKLLHVVIMWS